MNKTSAWNLVDSVAPHCRTLLLHGRPGTGKSYLAQRGGNPEKVYTLTLTPETPAAEIRGHYVPSAGGQFLWQDGPAIRAWREGARLVINEIDLASGDVQGLLYAICDSPDTASLTLPTGETVIPAEGFSVIATTNANPSEFPEALRSRFPVAVEVDEAHPAALNGLPEHMRHAAKASIAHPEDGQRTSIRAWKAFAELINKGVSEEEAAQAVFAERAGDIITAVKLARA